MFRKLTVVNDRSEQLVIDFYHPEKSMGIAIRSIEGLGPPASIVNKSTYAGADGSIFQSAKVESRNIVFDLILLEHQTVPETRQLTYRFFPLKKEVTLIFETDTRHVKTSGYVETNEPDIFSNQVSASISIICMDPYFYDLGETVVSFASMDPSFEFPFYNDSSSDDILIFSEKRSGGAVETVNYKGEVETGVVMTIGISDNVPQTVEDIHLYNLTRNEEMIISTERVSQLIEGELLPGDTIVITTLIGNKKTVHHVREDVITNIISALGMNPDWIRLSPGDNIIHYAANQGSENLEFEFRFNNSYQGV